MAEIFLARAKAAHGFEKLVVLKRILPQYAEDEDFVRMLLDEARLAATLHHPNIVQVYDMGIDEDLGQSFFTMEYVRGQDLRRIIKACVEKKGWPPLEHVLSIVTGVAAGLHHAHEQVGLDGDRLDIVHRDVSPSNILVTYTGAVKLVDFGIAKATVAQSNTRHGTLKGKIPYMSPEQCRGERLDRRSDIFSLGTVLWELSTGSRLFKSDNELATLSRIANEDAPPPSQIAKDYPKDLERIVMRALRRDRDERYQTAQEFQLELEEFTREHKVRVSATYLGRYMQELFADTIAKETRAARADPDKSIQTLLTADLDFLAPRALEMDGIKTTEFTPSELKVPKDAIPTREPSHGSHSESVVLPVAGAQTKSRQKLIVGGAALGLVAGVAIWVATSGTSPAAGTDGPAEQPSIEGAQAESTKAPPSSSAEDATDTSPEPVPVDPKPQPLADPAPAEAPTAAPAEAGVAAAGPAKTPKKTKRKKKRSGPKGSSKKDKDWNRDSALLPP